MSSVAFLKMLEGYRSTIGSAYLRQDVNAVVRVFREFADHEATTQDQIRQATGLTASNLNKIVKRACEKGWIHREASRDADGTKGLSLSAKGRKTFEDFESRCATVCSGSGTTIETSGAATQARGKQSLRRRIEQAKARSLSFFPEQDLDE
jgi:DNA-binding MarR family transcriptional regulator